MKRRYVRPVDVEQWRVGDTLRTRGEERIVTWVGKAVVELSPATCLRRAWYWLRRALQTHSPAAGQSGAPEGGDDVAGGGRSAP
jgi:hypothetical protein